MNTALFIAFAFLVIGLALTAIITAIAEAKRDKWGE